MPAEQCWEGDGPKNDGGADRREYCAIEGVHSEWRENFEVWKRADFHTLLTRLEDALGGIRRHEQSSTKQVHFMGSL